MKNKTTNLTFRVPTDLKAQFVELAKANGTTATALFHQWMEEYVSGKKSSTDNVSADSTYSTNNAHTDSTYNQLANRVSYLEEARSDHSQRIYELELEIQEFKSSTNSTDNALTNNSASTYSTDNTSSDESKTLQQADSDSTNKTSAISTDKALTNNDSPTDSHEGGQNQGSGSPQKKDDSEQLTHLGPLTQLALGKRLGCSSNAIQQQRKQGAEKLKQWSKQKDPHGIAWEYGTDQKYHPLFNL